MAMLMISYGLLVWCHAWRFGSQRGSAPAPQSFWCNLRVNFHGFPRPRSPKEKWGRHCCRPHSHRRVVKSEDMNLASDVSPSFCTEAQISGSVTGARTGIRFHPPAKSSRTIEAEAVTSRPVHAISRRFRGRISLPVPRAVALRPAQRPFVSHPSGAGRTFRPVTVARCAALNVALASGRSRLHEFLKRCGTGPVTSSRFGNSRIFSDC